MQLFNINIGLIICAIIFFVIIYANVRLITRKHLIVRHASTRIVHLQVAVKRNEVLGLLIVPT
jgi:hypothetical protein